MATLISGKRLRPFVFLAVIIISFVTVYNVIILSPVVNGVQTFNPTLGGSATPRLLRPSNKSLRVAHHEMDVYEPTALRSSPHLLTDVALSFHFSVDLQELSEKLIRGVADRFLAQFDAFHSSDPIVPKHKVDSTCGYVDGQRSKEKLRKHDYSHRVKRKGEKSNMEMYETVKSLSGPAAFFEFGPFLPTLLNQVPVQLSPEFDLSEAFGSWSTKFLPLPVGMFRDDGTQRHNVVKPETIKHFHSPQRMEPQPPAYVGMFHNSIVSHGHVVTCSGDVLTAGGCLWDFHLPAIHSAKDVDEEIIAVALCDEWCKGYYHFTHEHLPRLAVVHKLLLEREGAKLVLSHSPNGFQRQFLTDILGIPQSKIVYGKPVLGSTVVYPMPMRCGNTFTTMLYMLRKIVYGRLDMGEGPTLDSVSANEGKKLRLLFAERKHLSRMPDNYADLKRQLVVDFAEEFDFETTLGDTTALKQVELFHQADVVIGPHGANIANMMWMRHGTHVIEIASRRKGNMCYYATASRINVTHHLVLHDKGKDARFVLDYDYLKKHVSHAVKVLRNEALRRS